MKGKHHYIDPALSGQATESLQLTIHLSNDQFAYKVTNAYSQILAFECNAPSDSQLSESDFFDWVRSHELLKKSYGETKVIWEGNKFTLVPGDLFSEHQLEAYAKPLFAKPGNELIRSCQVDGMNGVFSMDEKIYYAVRSKFFDGKLSHQSAVNCSRAMAKRDGTDNLLAWFYKGWFQVVHMEQGRLRFCNHFMADTSEEAIYHIVNTYDKLKLSRERVPFFYEGLEDSDPLLNLMNQYIFQTGRQPLSLPKELIPLTGFHSFLAS